MYSTGRQRALIIPREHGAWGILLVPLSTGACVGLLAGGNAESLAPLSLVAFALFWLRTPVESWMGTVPVRAHSLSEIRLVRNTSLILAVVSIGAVIWLFWGGRNRALLWIGGIAAAAFLAQAVLKQTGWNVRMAAQMIGAAGLTAAAPAAYYAVAGHLSMPAWSLWAANLLFAINQIHFVQLRIRASHTDDRSEKLSTGRGFLAGQVLLVALITIACALRLFGWYAAAAFLPVLCRGFAWFAVQSPPFAVRTLGKSELVYGCLFGVFLVLGFEVR